jgi:hypothetical protein
MNARISGCSKTQCIATQGRVLENPIGKRYVGRSRCNRKENVKEVIWENLNWIQLGPHSNEPSSAIKWGRGIFLTSQGIISFIIKFARSYLPQDKIPRYWTALWCWLPAIVLCIRMRPSVKVRVVVPLNACIREVFGSYLGWEVLWFWYGLLSRMLL